MNLNNVDLMLSAVSKRQYPNTELPEIAFAGRSNVGKSSLINKLLNRKKVMDLKFTTSDFSLEPQTHTRPSPLSLSLYH